MFSANVALEGDGRRTRDKDEGRTIPDDEVTNEGQTHNSNSNSNSKLVRGYGGAGVSVAIALTLMVGIFFVLPVLAAKLITSIANNDLRLF